MKEASVCVSYVYDKNLYEIDFLKIINEAIGEGKWANLGIDNQDKLKVFYPDKTSVYWHDFYDFMLVTVNNGKYPESIADELILK